jgi:enoyl-CoA hydratase
MVTWNPTVAATAPLADRVVSYAVADGVATLTVCRPRKMNALSLEVFRQLNALVSQVQTDDAVRAVIVTGEGDRAFSAGADVTDLVGLSSAAAYEFSASGQYVFDQLAELPKPVVAAINGVALGGGLELALACDIRIAADTARFGQPEILLANTPGWGATQRLTRVVGVGRAKAMMLTGDQIDAATALHYGLVTDVAPAAELPARAAALARRLAGMAPTAVHAIKEAVHVGLEGGIEAGLRAERVGVAACCGTPEQAAAVDSFTHARHQK